MKKMYLLIAGVSIALSFCLSMAQGGTAPSGSKSGAGTENGRFQIIQLSEYARHQFMIDTHTGNIWKNVCIENDEKGECTDYLWSHMSVEDINWRPAPQKPN